MSTSCLVPVLSILFLMSTFIVAESHQSNRHRKNEHDQDRSRADFVQDVKERAKAAIDDFKNRIEEFRNEIRDHFSSENSDNENWQSNLRKLIKEHIENSVKSRIKDKLDDASSSASSDSESSSIQSGELVHQKDKDDKSSEPDKDKCDEGDGEEISDAKNGKLINKEGEDPSERDSIIQDITEQVKNVKSKIIKKVLADKKYIKAHLHQKLSMLREALRKLAASNDDDNDEDDDDDDKDNTSSSEEDGAAKITLKDIIKEFCDNFNKTHHQNASHFYHEILHIIWERFGSEIEELNSTRQEFLQAKEEMIEAAKKLHDYHHNIEVKKSRLQLLVAFKFKLRQMILKKKQYLTERSELREKIRLAFRDIFRNKSEGYSTTPNDLDVIGNGHGSFQTEEPNYEFTRRSSSEEGEEIQGTDDPRSIAESEEIQGTDDPRTTAESDEMNIFQKFGRSTTEQSDESGNVSGNSSHFDGLNLAAGYRGSGVDDDDDDDGGNSSAVVVLIVIACLVATAGVVILGAVMWKRQRRHRLYAKIPSRHELL